MIDQSQAIDVVSAELEPWPLDRDQIVAGFPRVFGRVLDGSDDGRIQRGIWEHTPVTSTDVEADELFVVISGQATVTIDGGASFELAPGFVGLLRAGDRSTWTVRETLRKVYQVTR